MALNVTQQNVIRELQKIATEEISIKYRMIALVQMYVNENIAAVTTQDLQSVPDFAHIAAAELADAGAALAAINTTIGDFSVGSNAAKLLKIVKVVPR